MALDAASVWPSDVILDNQNNYGTGWDIGAYVYTQTSTPSIALTAPTGGSTLSGIQSITATASAVAPASVSTVQFSLDGNSLTTVSSSPYSYNWDTTQTSNGSHTLTALATDNYGNQNTATTSITVSNITTPSVVVGVGAGYTPEWTPPASTNGTSTIPTSTIPAASSTPSNASSSSSGMTTAQMQALLASLESQLQALEAQAGITRDLSLWATGPDVRALQAYLIQQDKGPAAERLKAHGVTTVFGMLTYHALVEFQSSVGITPAAGYFGAKTRAWVGAHP